MDINIVNLVIRGFIIVSFVLWGVVTRKLYDALPWENIFQLLWFLASAGITVVGFLIVLNVIK